MNGFALSLNAALANERMKDLEREAREYRRVHNHKDLEPASPRSSRPRVRWWQRSDPRVSGA